MEKAEFLALIDRYLDGPASEAEREQLHNYAHSFQSEDKWDEEAYGSRKEAATVVIGNIEKQIALHEKKPRRMWLRYAAAVAILLVGAALFIGKPWKQSQESATIITAQDLQPASKKAYLTLSNGSTVVLQDLQAGAKVGDAVKTADGKLIYNNLGSATVAYNTLTVPRGGAVQYVQLPDGTSVWLNTASSITYPTAFTGNDRRVEITGEAYFEVSKNGKPFYVKTRTDEIAVLGTHFNINAYEDETLVKTTLLEGKVRVGALTLAPGEQHAGGKIRSADVTDVMAWRNGIFSFGSGVDVKNLMRELSRWYDVEVVFEGVPTTKRFEGKIGRQLTLKQVLEGLSFTDLNYRLEKTAGGNRIVMLP